MKILILFFAIFLNSATLSASCVDWHQVYQCQNGEAFLMQGHSWCGQRSTDVFQLNILSQEARAYISQLARNEVTSLNLIPTQSYGVFRGTINSFVTAQIREDHFLSTLNIELFLDQKKIGQYMFSGCLY